MPEGDGAAQGASQAQGAEGSTGGETQTQTQQSGGGGEGNGEPFDKDRALATIRAQRESENALKEELRTAREELKRHEDAKLSESERSSKRVTELEGQVTNLTTELRNVRVQTEAAALGREKGAIIPEDLWKLLDLEKLELDADGKPKNLGALIDKLKQDRPALFSKPASFDGGGREQAGSGGDMNAILRKAAGRS